MKRQSRGSRASRIYRSAAPDAPSARTDARILSAACRAARPEPERRRLLFVGAMAATVLVAFTARWLGDDSPLPDSHAFGLAEGQSRDYLLQFDPLTTGPGSQEGVP